jgi:Tfp pilus assembly ATPase PilU
VPFVRVDGEPSPTTFGAMSAADTEAAALCADARAQAAFVRGHRRGRLRPHAGGVGRFRGNVFRQGSMVGLAIRRVHSEVPTVAELNPHRHRRTRGLEPRARAGDGADRHRQTTTIASMIGHINRTWRAHIVTIEDPIEVVHHDERAIIQQREAGVDTESYAAACGTSCGRTPT